MVVDESGKDNEIKKRSKVICDKAFTNAIEAAKTVISLLYHHAVLLTNKTDFYLLIIFIQE